MGLVSQAVDWNPVWDHLLEIAPEIGSSPNLYTPWLNGVLSVIDAELELMPEKLAILNEQFTTIEGQYKVETVASHGLASTLVIEKTGNESPSIEIIRPGGTLTLVGGLIGFLVWGLWEFTNISRKSTV
jgi:hypothetical protein